MFDSFLVAKVALSNTTYGYDTEYSYSVPENMRDKILPGVRVIVPFGRGNRKRIGFVTRTYVNDFHNSELKPVHQVIDAEPLINDEHIKLIYWLKENTFCTYYEAFKTIVPSGYQFNFNTKYSLVNAEIDEELSDEEAALVSLAKSANSDDDVNLIFDCRENAEKKRIIDSLIEKGVLEENNILIRRVGDEKEKMVRLSEKYDDDPTYFKFTPKQKKIIDMLLECETASIKEVCYITGVTPSIINNLIKKDALTLFEYEVYRTPIDFNKERNSPDAVVLSEKQNEVFKGVSQLVLDNKPSGALLRGVTGSGKTSIYVKLIDFTLKQGKTALMLVPEISLTPQMISRFTCLFGEDVAVIHSSLSLGQRMDEYKRIKNKKARVVIGTRSAVFAPLENLGLIIMDEEGEHTYKSESSPRYHARDVAVQRCGYNNATLLLGSATPSLESYFHAVNGRFSLFELDERYSDAKLPKVAVVDMQLEVEDGNKGIFSRELLKNIQNNLDNKEQTILLLNRRGFHTYISCESCREPIECPNCAVPLTYHVKNNKLMCHYCGYTKNMDTECPKCHSNKLRTSGTGTQKIEDELLRLFPDVRVLRMDADTTGSRYSFEKNIKDFEDGKFDILLGTQMIAKGLDFPNVTLVGVLSLDKVLYAGDFKSYERTFSLVTQVVGRSGRGEKNGVAFIQTYNPEHYVLKYASSQDYKSFYEEEISLRKALLYPPFCDICLVGFTSPVEAEAKACAEEFLTLMKNKISSEGLKLPLRVLGPSKFTVGKINNKFRYRLIIKCKNNKDFRKLISELLKDTYKLKSFSNVKVFADINGDL